MDRGTYISAAGGIVQLQKLDQINNNLANINTPGFKRQVLVTSPTAFDQTLAGQMDLNDPYASGDNDRTPLTTVVGAFTDFSQGPIETTGNPLNVAPRNAKDFFVINTAQGPQYTRAGNFTLNTEGELVTADGQPVQGDGGAIVINGPGAQITSSGQITVNGTSVGTLRVVRIEDPSKLEHVAGSRFKAGDGQEVGESVEPDLAAGALEMSNTSALQNMIALIAANRAFQVYTKTAQTIDETNNTAVTRIGRRT